MIDPKIKFITVLGPTASGKSNLAIGLAERFNGEIVCADSRTIYRGMDIGTAKPTPSDQRRVPHHLIDILDPGQRLSAAEFKCLAELKITEIAARNRVPIVVGGSGLYLDSLLFDFRFPPEASKELRQELESLSTLQLTKRLQDIDPDGASGVDLNNRVRIIRAIETAGQPRQRRTKPVPGVLIIGLSLNKEVIQKRIDERIEKMLDKGFIDEVRQIGERYGWDSEAFNIIGYRAFKDHVNSTKALEEAKADFAHGDMALVRKQLTWWRRNPYIRWIDNPAAAYELAERFLTSR